MYRKNTSGQFVGFQMLLTASGAIATGLSPAVRRCIDGTFAAGGGTVTEDTGTGGYKYAMSQADTNGNDISFWFSAATAMPVCVNIVTTAADPTNAATFGITDIDAAISTRMATYIQPTGFLSATFPSGTVANTTNITAGTIATVTNPVSITSNIKENTGSQRLTFTMTDSTNHAPSPGLTVVSEVSIDGAGFISTANSVSGIANGDYTLVLNAADTNGKTLMFRFTEATADDLNIMVITQP
jgi:hypothetical protein